MDALDVDVSFDSAESAEMKSNDSAFIFYLNIKNNLSKQIKVELPHATYLSCRGEEIEQDFWLGGLINGGLGATIRAGAYKRTGICIDQRKLKSVSTGDRIFVTLNVVKLSLRISFEFICSDGPQKQFSLHSANKEEIESETSQAQQMPTQTERDAPAQTGDDSAPSMREITSLIERLELLEEKFGIVISGMYATCDLDRYGSPPKHTLSINFDVTSLRGGKLNSTCKVNANAYNAAGQLLATVPSYIKSDFMGFGSMSISAGLDQVPAKIRLFPSDW